MGRLVTIDPRRKISRYHVAKLMELRYGRRWSWRRIASMTGLSTGGIRAAIARAEAGELFPEATPHFIRVIPRDATL